MLDEVVSLIVETIKSGNKVLAFGVGGNAANAMHFAAELSGKFEQYEEPLPCICLNDNVSVLTAITNDFGWEHVFERQIEGLAKPGDVVVAFSISTKGEYLLNALREAFDTKVSSILICGKVSEGCWPEDLKWRWEPQLVWELGSLDTPWVQEEQLRIIHQVCGRVKAELSIDS